VSVSIRTWDGDVKALRALAERSWPAELRASSYPDLYDPGLLELLLGPVASRDHLLGAYNDADELVGFLANLPRRYLVRGRTFHGVVACMLTTRPDHRRAGVAKALIAEALDRLERAGLDFALFYLGDPTRFLPEAEGRLVRVRRMSAMGRVLDFEKVRASERLRPAEVRALRMLRKRGKIGQVGAVPGILREYEPEDLDGALALVNRHAMAAELGRLWTREEIAPMLETPDVAHTVVYERGGAIAGVASYTLIRHLGADPEPWAWVEHFAVEHATINERSALMRKLLNHAKQHDCAGVVEWSKGYYPIRHLLLDGFIPARRRIVLWAWLFNPEVGLEQLRRVYAEHR